jgi:hypothetical protein
MAVNNQLFGSFARRRKIQFINNIVQASFQQLKQGLAGIAPCALGFVEIPHKLPLHNAVIPFELLLFAQPNAVFACSASAPAVHTRAQITLFFLDRALSRLAAYAFEHKLYSFATAKFTG